MTEVDLSQLAVERQLRSPATLHNRRHILTRYVLPAALAVGFLSLVAWAAYDLIFPAHRVTVVPVLATRAEFRQEGAPLFKAAGWIEPRPTPVRVAALAPGVVEKLLVVEDQPVKANEPVAELIKDDARLAYDGSVATAQLRAAELQQSEARLAAANLRYQQPVHLQAELAKAEADLAQMETMIKNLPFETRRAVASLEFARKEHRRNLEAKHAVSKSEVDEAESKLESAKALVEEYTDRDASLKKEIAALISQRNALSTKLELLADEIKARDEAIALVNAAKARVEQARVAVAEATLRLERMTVRAPVDGRIYQLLGHPGSRIGSEMNQGMRNFDGSTVVTLYRPDMLQIRVDVRFEDIPMVSLNQPVAIENAAIVSPIKGTVLFISSEADIQKNTLQVKVAIDSPPAVFKPEMLVDVTFLSPKRTDPGTAVDIAETTRIYVPKQLIQKDDDAAFVWVADQSAGVARKTQVQTGSVGAGGFIEIVGGLTVSSRLISGGREGLSDGQRIEITGEEENASFPTK